MKLRILPDNLTLEVAAGVNLLDALSQVQIALDNSCGGEGICGQCRVQIREGGVEAEQGPRQSNEEYEQGWRQACLATLSADVAIFIPEDSRLEREVLYQRIAPSGQYLTDAQIARLNPGWQFDPPLKKYFVELPIPTLKDNINDLDRLLRELRKHHGLRKVSVDFPILPNLPDLLRQDHFRVTATVAEVKGEEGSQSPRRRPKLIRVEPGDTRSRHYSFAVDIGTTTISGQILDLNKKKPLATQTQYNAQVRHGADVISRIVYAVSRPDGLATLQRLVVETINHVLAEAVKKSKIQLDNISHLSAAGNTTMTHLLLGLNPRWLRMQPYTPALNQAPPVRAKDLGIKVGPWAHLYTFPSVASYVGGDIVAGVLAAGIYKRSPLTLYIDIGTNGEIVLGNRDWMLTASCSAGPAFEGGGIKHGMHAGPGAIERFTLDRRTGEARVATIGHHPALGLCGSGMINTVAELLRAGVIDPNGKVNLHRGSPLVREGEDGPEVVIAPAGQTASGQDITLSDLDLDNLLRAKAAMYAGCHTLLQHVGLKFEDVQEVLIAGAFGNYLDIENAITIGLLPDLDRNRFKFIGNGSLLGARLVSFSNALLDDAEHAARLMTNVELSDNPTFMDQYMAALFLPHTDQRLFPGIARRIQENRGESPSPGVHL